MYRLLILGMFAIPAVPVHSQVVTYEASAFPETQGWTRGFFCTPERWLDDGCFYQFVEEDASACGKGDVGDMDWYTRPLAVFQGVDRFFIEWCMEATGPQSEVDLSAPAVLVAGSLGAVKYHFTISRDLVRIIRDNLLPILFIEIAPKMVHTYRVDLDNDAVEPRYETYIDGQLIDDGIAEGAYPSSTPTMTWASGAWFHDNQSRWTFIRYGRTPDDGSGDFDGSGAADVFDLFYFSECIDRSLAGEAADPSCQWADFNADNTVDCTDAAAFAAIYTGDPADAVFTQCPSPIPAVSDWGVAVLALLIVSVGTVTYRNRSLSKYAG
ncbi:MAG: hypothetical protein ACE5E5_10905 [Phycisphaerae bacterium]